MSSTPNLTRQYRLMEWAEAICQQKASGMTIQQWCEENSVTQFQFYYRQRAVRKAMTPALKQHMLERLAADTEWQLPTIPEVKQKSEIQQVTFAKVPDHLLQPSFSGTAMCIRKGNVTIEVSNDASDRLLSLLREVILYAD